MYSGDELYDDEVTSVPFDLLAYVDDARKRKRETFACLGCGAEDPARLSSDCTSCSECELIIERTDGYVVTADRGA